MADFKTELHPVERQELTNVLSVEQRYSLELLHYSALDLAQYLADIVATNPMLDEQSEEKIDPVSSITATDIIFDNNDESQIDEQAVENAETWADELPFPSIASSAEEGNIDPFLRSMAPLPTPEEQLMQELETDKIHTQEEIELARFIVESLNESGFLTLPLADVAMICNCELEEVEAALDWVQSLDPPGIGARNLSECLELQLKRCGEWSLVYHELLTAGIELLERNQLPQLAKRLQINTEELNKLLERLRRLNPAPGRQLDLRPAIVMEAELEIYRSADNGNWQVRLLKEQLPRFNLSQRYVKLLEDTTTSPETKEYLKEKLTQAQEVLRAIERRGNTLLNIGNLLILQQPDFLEYGVKYLRPMTMRQAGEALQLHESTISRAVANKFIITPRGTFPLKFFFSASRIEKNGKTISMHSIMERIKELISNEDPYDPLTDKALKEQLNKEGFWLKQRTVSKYRELQKIPKRSLRRKH